MHLFRTVLHAKVFPVGEIVRWSISVDEENVLAGFETSMSTRCSIVRQEKERSRVVAGLGQSNASIDKDNGKVRVGGDHLHIGQYA